MHQVELYSATISFTNKILRVVFKNGVNVELNEAIQLVDVSLDLVKGQSFYLLVDARDILSSMDHESRKYIAEHKRYNELNIAQAIIVNNIPIRLLATFYFRYYKHVNPVKIFTEKEEAMKWLLDQS